MTTARDFVVEVVQIIFFFSGVSLWRCSLNSKTHRQLKIMLILITEQHAPIFSEQHFSQATGNSLSKDDKNVIWSTCSWWKCLQYRTQSIDSIKSCRSYVMPDSIIFFFLNHIMALIFLPDTLTLDLTWSERLQGKFTICIQKENETTAVGFLFLCQIFMTGVCVTLYVRVTAGAE